MFNKSKKLSSIFLLMQFLWTSVYMPVANAQVPPKNSGAGDWNVYKESQEGGTNYTNLLLVLDTSDSMNQPESWRPYAGSYNSHIEYLWNDPSYVARISTDEPVAPTDLYSSTQTVRDQVRVGYWTYNLNEGDGTIEDAPTRLIKRQEIQKAANVDVNTPISLSFHPSNPALDVQSGLPKSVYRNYGGPVNESKTGMNTNAWFNAGWVYWTKAGSVSLANLHLSPYLYSTSFSRFHGANAGIAGLRANINYSGDVNANNMFSLDEAGGQGSDYERFNLCEVSKYDASVTKLTGVGIIATGIKPSTVYAPAVGHKLIEDGALKTNKAVSPTTLFNTGYSQNIKMVRFDPYAKVTQTRKQWLLGYPGAGLIGDFSTVWPPVSYTDADGNYVSADENESNYFVQSYLKRFRPGYLDLRCWDGGTLDTSKTLFSSPACNYSVINPPMRDNYIIYKSQTGNYATNPFAVNQAFGDIGQPIRVLRAKLTVDSSTPKERYVPKDRFYKLTYGGCGNIDTSKNVKVYDFDSSSNQVADRDTISIGGYLDYECSSNSDDLWMSWTKLRSDNGGFINANALYQLATQINTPNSENTEEKKTAFRVKTLENMLKVYQVSPFPVSSTRWGKKNDGSAITARALDATLFSAFLGTRDCFEVGNSNANCATRPADEEYATGTPAYWDHTRSTYHYWEKPDSKSTVITNLSDINNCYDANGNTVACGRYVDGVGNNYATNTTYMDPIIGAPISSSNACVDSLGRVAGEITCSTGCKYGFGHGTAALDAADTKAKCEALNCGPYTAGDYCDSSWLNRCIGITGASTPSLDRVYSSVTGFKRPVLSSEIGSYTDTPGTAGVACPAGKFPWPRPVWVDSSEAVKAGVPVKPAPTPYIRTGTYKIKGDPNRLGQSDSDMVMENNSENLSGIISHDASDTIGDTYPNGIDNLALGAREIIDKTTHVRRFANCVADTSTMKYVVTEAAQGTNNPNHIFTNYFCKLNTSYSAASDCQKKDSTGVWRSVGQTADGVTVTQAMCAGLAAPACSQPAAGGGSTRMYGAGSCGFFSYTDTYEGVSGFQSYGKSCSATQGRTVYLIDWDNPTSTSSANNLKSKYINWLTVEAAKINNQITTPVGGISSVNDITFKNFSEVTRAKRQDPACTYWEAPAVNNGNQLCTMNAGPTTTLGRPFGKLFDPVFWNRDSSNNYVNFNAGVSNNASCYAQNVYISTDSIACTTAAVAAGSNPNNGYTVVSGYPDSSSALTAAKNNATCNDGEVIASTTVKRDSNKYGRFNGRLPFYVFEAYNVDKFGVHQPSNVGQNRGSILNDPLNGRYMPILFHGCTNSTPSLGVGDTAKWAVPVASLPSPSDASATPALNKVAFYNFYKFAQSTYVNLNPDISFGDWTTKFPQMVPTSDLSGNGQSSVDLFSANYLNYRFGPKYNGAPIGRRTRIQVAQDVMAGIIASSNKGVRIGLMSFGYINANSRTAGGYVVKAVKTLEDTACFEKTLTGTVSSDLTTINLDSASAPINWIELTYDTAGVGSMPSDFIRSAKKYGGVVFPNGVEKFDPVAINAIDANGNITLATQAPVASGTSTFVLKNCNLPNYTGLGTSSNRYELITALYSLKAVAQTPITETIYEAYLYYSGGAPNNGITVVADPSAFDSSTPSKYISPMKSLVTETGNPNVCMQNYLILITDGYPYDDSKANNLIAGLTSTAKSGSAIVATNLANDTTRTAVVAGTIDTSTTYDTGFVNIRQFKDPATSNPYEHRDAYYTGSNNYSLFDELAYFMGNANLTPLGVNGRYNVAMFAITMDLDCSPVIKNGLELNNGARCNSTRDSEEFADALQDIISSLHQWVPSATAASIPLPATNRSSSSIDIYMGLFLPSNKRLWTGNMKKYKLSFSPIDCGFDSNFRPIDICIIGKNVLETYTVGNATVRQKNIMSRTAADNDLALHPDAVDFFSTEVGVKEGRNVELGGVNSQMVAGGYPAPAQVYTFLSLDSKITTVQADLKNSQNLVAETNMALLDYDQFAGPSTTQNEVKATVRFMLGATPSTTPSSTTATLRENAHGDVMHSRPATATYLNASTTETRLYYLTGNGDLMAVVDSDTATPANNGKVKWRFYPEETLQQQINIRKLTGANGGDQKVFGADGGVSTLIFDKNKDGFVNPAEDKVVITFGLRRGGRAIYGLDVTDPDGPKLLWRMSNQSFCTAISGPLVCTKASSMASTYLNIPTDFLDELGYTWSTPVMGFVNYKPAYVNTAYQNIIDNVKARQPVAIFGAGYDPDEDNVERNPLSTPSTKMGRALYVVDALTGQPLKMWYKGRNKTTNNPTGAAVGAAAVNTVGKMVTNLGAPVSAANCLSPVSVGAEPLLYPFVSAPYAYNVDFDAENTIDRIYIGDTGGQVFRFDIGEKDLNNWRGTLMADLSYQISRTDMNYNAPTNISTYIDGNGASINVKRKSRKIILPPVRAGWTRGKESYDYIYVTTGDIEHPWSTTTEDLTAVFLDPETGISMRCAPPAIVKTRNLLGLSGSSVSIYDLVDITNVGRVDRNGDGVIDKQDIRNASPGLGAPVYGSAGVNVTRENIGEPPITAAIKRAFYAGLNMTRTTTNGAMGWFYRMERGEKGVSQPRVIDGVLSWTAFSSQFGALSCSIGTGTKYYLDAYWGTTVDTNLDGKANNCLANADEDTANTISLLQPANAASFGTATPSQAKKESDAAENLLRTPKFMPTRTVPPEGSKAGGISTHCDSPRPIYNTSYGLLAADAQVVHDGKIYRVGIVPQGNARDGVYDEDLNFLGNDFKQSQSSSNPTGGTQLLGSGASSYYGSATSASNAPGAGGVSGFGASIGYDRRPGQLYWFRDDLR